MEQKPIPKNGYAFRVSYDELSRANQRLLREEIMARLRIKRETFYLRMKGIIPLQPDFLIIKEIFERYNIKKVFDYERTDKERDGGC